MKFLKEIRGIRFYSVKPDFSGKQRIVCRFDNLNTPEDYNTGVKLHYIAVNRARKIGGQIYRGKDFPGGIVFTGSPEEIEQRIRKVLES